VAVLLLGERNKRTFCTYRLLQKGAWNAYGNVSKWELLKAQIKNLTLKIKHGSP
jgi:hypothetical protein